MLKKAKFVLGYLSYLPKKRFLGELVGKFEQYFLYWLVMNYLLTSSSGL